MFGLLRLVGSMNSKTRPLKLLNRIPVLRGLNGETKPRSSAGKPSLPQFIMGSPNVLVTKFGSATRTDIMVLWRRLHLIISADRAKKSHVVLDLSYSKYSPFVWKPCLAGSGL